MVCVGCLHVQVDKQRKGKKAAQTAAEKALDSLAAALRRISTLENERTRSERDTAHNGVKIVDFGLQEPAFSLLSSFCVRGTCKSSARKRWFAVARTRARVGLVL